MKQVLLFLLSLSCISALAQNSREVQKRLKEGESGGSNGGCTAYTWYLDADNDGYWTGSGIIQCTSPGVGYRNSGLIAGNDCNDSNANMNPGQPEIAGDGIDNNCNGTIDEANSVYIYYRDADGDGLGNPDNKTTGPTTTPPAGYVVNALDCNDNDASNSTIIYVNASVIGGANNGSSWANAYANLQDALASNVNGCASQIWVAKGTYYPDEGGGKTNNDRMASFVMRNNLAIYGGFAGNEPATYDLSLRNLSGNETILSGDIDKNDGPSLTNMDGNSYHVILNNQNGLDNSAILDGFTIRSGKADLDDGTSTAGAGILNRSAAPFINNCKFTQNVSSFGGAIVNANANGVKILNTVFELNVSVRGGGVYNALSTTSFENCNFIDNLSFGANQQYFGGGAIENDQSSNTSILDCRFTNNQSALGGAISNIGASQTTITNSTFNKNSANGSGAVFNYGSSSGLSLINCSFWKNSAPQLGSSIASLANSSLLATNCIIWGGQGSVDVVSLDGSSTNISYSIVRDPNIPKIYAGKNGNLDIDPLYVDPDNGDLHLSPSSPAVNTGNDAANSEPYDLDGNDRKLGIIDMGAYETQFDCPQGTILYVNKNATGANNGRSWADAYTTLQDALADPCPAITQIWVAKGTYYPDEGGGKTNNDRSASFSMKRGLSLYGGFAGTETNISQRNLKINTTILSGDLLQNDNPNISLQDLYADPSRADNSYHVILNDFTEFRPLTASSRLDGFTITGGNGNGSSPDVAGGGISNTYASPTIVNCIFSRNSASIGGGVFNRFYSSPEMRNCLLEYNYSFARGGGIYNLNYCSPRLVNCTITENLSQQPGYLPNSDGALWNGADCSTTFTNCILWRNLGSSSPYGSGIQNQTNASTAITTVTYSIVQSGFPGEGNLNTDPLFVNAGNADFHLQSQSPALEAGNDNANPEALDLDGNPRKTLVIDMGAYELAYDCPNPTQWVKDNDHDGYYSGKPEIACTSPGEGFIIKGDTQPGDCDDNDNTIYPGAPELCDGKDNDCDGSIDNGLQLKPMWRDEDGDGKGAGLPELYACAPPPGYAAVGNDCAPNDPNLFYIGFAYVDNDGDGYTVGDKIEICYGHQVPKGYSFSTKGEDCNDNDATVPNVYYPDEDEDGYTATGVIVCATTPPPKWKAEPSSTFDCNDNDPLLQRATLYWPDADGDGYGFDISSTTDCWMIVIDYTRYRAIAVFTYARPDCSTTVPTNIPKFFCSSTPPPGYAAIAGDCNDNDASIYPGANEIRDGKDNDCDGEVDECTFSLTTNELNPLQISGCGTDDIATSSFAYAAAPVSLTIDELSLINFPVTEGSCPIASVSYVDAIDEQASAPGKVVVIRTFTIKDVGDNEATATQVITVEDDVLPTITAPSDIAGQPNDAGNCGAAVANVILGLPVVGDNCTATDDLVVSNNAPAIFPVGTTEVIWKVVDAAGNASTAIQKVTVVDTEKPTITAPVNVSAKTSDDGSGNCTTSVILGSPITNDNCAVDQVWNDAPPVFNIGTTTVTWTVIDIHGNKSTATQQVTVTDDELPVITCPGNQVLVLDANCNAVIPDYTGLAVASDNCGVKSMTQVPAAGTQVNGAGGVVVSLTVTDNSNNTSSCSFTVSKLDKTPPVITAVTASPASLWPPNHQMKPVTVSVQSEDNCSPTTCRIISVSSNEPVDGTGDGDKSPDWEITGTNTLNLRAERAGNGNGRIYTITVECTDASGNTSTATTSVIVAHDIKAPISGASFKVGSTVSFAGTFWDLPGNTHSARWVIDDNTTTVGTVTAEPSGLKNGTVAGKYKFNSPGVYKLRMEITDQNGNVSYANTRGDLDAIVVVYDPNGGNTYGGGSFRSPAGALTSDPSATGLVSYGFQNNYFKTATKPRGETQMRFELGDFEFNAVNFDYLVVDKYKAQLSGYGKISGGQSGVAFVMTVIDGQVKGGGGVDKIRLKVFNKNTGEVYYDNQPGASDADAPTTAVNSGSTVVINGTSNAPAVTMKEPAQHRLNIRVNNNPAGSGQPFLLQLQSTDELHPIMLKLVDGFGRVVGSYSSLQAGSTIPVGSNWVNGLYFAEAVQDNRRVVVKLLKQ